MKGMGSGHEFDRTRLMLGAAAMERLWGSSAAVFGIGGVGSHCAQALARSGVGRLILTDDESVSETNLNRQCVAWRSTIGQKKTKVMERMIREICPDTRVLTFETFVLPDNLDALFERAGQVDYILDAVDTVAAKLALAVYAKEHGIPILSSMGTGNKLHPERFRIADISETSVCPLCRVMRRELKKRGIEHLKVVFSDETPRTPDPEMEARFIAEENEKGSARRHVPGSVAFAPPAAGLIMAGEAVRQMGGV